MDMARYDAIFKKITSLKAELDALWMQPGGGKNISPKEANDIATLLLRDLQILVSETNINLARYAQSQAKG